MIPHGVSQADFAAAIAGFEAAVGKDWVFTSQEDTDLYRDAYSPFWGEPEEKLVSAAVAPDSAEQVQAVMRIANQHRIPIYPISTGKNLGYGGSAPVLSGSVVLDLKRMNRILEIDEKNAYALVEPGVSYFDLYRYIQEKGLKLWIDCPDPGWGSVIGNALDRGGGYTNALYRNHFDAHCGLEVVLPDGELLRTGMGALPGAKTWQQYKSGYGPWIDGLFSQTSLGVVTKMGIWLMPEPEAYLSGTVKVFRREDLIPLVEIMTRLENQEIYTGMPFFGSPLLGGLDPGDSQRTPPAPEVTAILARPGETDWAALERVGRDTGRGIWGCKFQFYGPAKVIQAQWEYAKEQLSAIPDAGFTDGELIHLPLSPADKERVHQVVFGVPNLSIFFIGARSDASPTPTEGHMWFSPIIPRTGEAIFEAQKVFGEAARQLGLPMSPLSLPGTYWRRAFIFIFGFPITHDPAVNKKNRAAFETMVRICAEHGWGEYRTAPAFQDAVMQTYAFNNHALRRFNEALKDAVDPNGILSAGHYGVWPRHLREDRR